MGCQTMLDILRRQFYTMGSCSAYPEYGITMPQTSDEVRYKVHNLCDMFWYLTRDDVQRDLVDECIEAQINGQ